MYSKPRDSNEICLLIEYSVMIHTRPKMVTMLNTHTLLLGPAQMCFDVSKDFFIKRVRQMYFQGAAEYKERCVGVTFLDGT